MTFEVTPYELEHLKRANFYGLLILLSHLPVLSFVAWYNHTSLLVTVLGVLLFVLGPAVLWLRNRSSELCGAAIAIAAMGVAALTIYDSNGIIEAHFEIFVLIALTTIFGRVLPPLIAGITIALHHVLFWLWLPLAAFSCKPSFTIVLIHAFFVIVEVIPACWIAHQYGRSVKVHGIVVRYLTGAAERIETSAEQIASSSQSLALGATHQASLIEETATATAEINAMAQRNTSNSRRTADMVSETSIRFEKTNGALNQMVTAVDGIHTSSGKISRIIKVIDQISFQTNILALNAAVEAARAGSAGLGFGVVADEVRHLAQRCAQAAQDTADLIEESTLKIEAGSSIVEEVTSQIRVITSDSITMKVMVDDINLGSHEQQKGVEQVYHAMQQMKIATEESAEAARKASETASRLTDEARLIGSIVDRLKELGLASVPKRTRAAKTGRFGTSLRRVSSSNFDAITPRPNPLLPPLIN